MKHFIGTRFNLPVTTWQTDKNNRPVLTEVWLEKRFRLFQNYCLPSVKNQSNQNFTWVVFFAHQTPTKYRPLIAEIAQHYPNFQPLYIADISCLQDAFSTFIQQQITPTDQFVLTSRLDNDDAIHRDYVATVQRLAIAKHQTVIDLRRGYQLDISTPRDAYRAVANDFNPFISWVERTDDLQTVFAKKHHEYTEMESIIIEDQQALWLEVIHQNNKINQANKHQPLLRTLDLTDFGITHKRVVNDWWLIQVNNALLPLRKLVRKCLNFLITNL